VIPGSPPAVSGTIFSRLISDKALSDRALGTISSSMRTCTEKQTRCSRVLSSEPFIIDSHQENLLPTRVLDLGFSDSSVIHLIATDNLRGKCATLGHRWGDPKAISQTTMDTIQDQMNSIEIRTLSTSFQDAVLVTRKLGIQYLWIDCLCIIQDSNVKIEVIVPYTIAALQFSGRWTPEATDGPKASAGDTA
jgi:hypothetical protein